MALTLLWLAFFICHNILRTYICGSVCQNHFKDLICIYVGGERCLWRPEDGIGPSGTGITWSPGAGCWELSPLEDQQMLLMTEFFLQNQTIFHI